MLRVCVRVHLLLQAGSRGYQVLISKKTGVEGDSGTSPALWRS